MRKPNGYWKVPDNIVAEARAAMKKHNWNILPGEKTLKKHGYSSLAVATKHVGGMFGLRKLLGQEKMKHPNGFWKDPVTVVSEARKTMQEQGWDTLPSVGTLQDHGYNSLSVYISKLDGGFAGLRRLLGEETLIHPRGFWQDPFNVVAEAKKIMGKENWKTLPSQKTLVENGYSRITNAAVYHGGMSGLRELLGQDVLERAKGYWKDPANIIAEAKEAMEKEGWDILPSSEILKDHGYGSLVTSSKYHGGVTAMRKLLGQPRLKRSNGFWKDPIKVVVEIRRIMQEQGWDTLPGGAVLAEHGYSMVAFSASYHGGMSGLRKLLGEKSLRRPNGYWNDPANIVFEARNIMDEHGWDTLPTQRTLYKHGCGAIASAAKHHGGIPGLRDLISKSLQQPTEQEQLEVLVGGYDA